MTTISCTGWGRRVRGEGGHQGVSVGRLRAGREPSSDRPREGRASRRRRPASRFDGKPPRPAAYPRAKGERRGGRSPGSRVFGASPRLPGSILPVAPPPKDGARIGRGLAAHSCGHSGGLGARAPHRLPIFASDPSEEPPAALVARPRRRASRRRLIWIKFPTLQLGNYASAALNSAQLIPILAVEMGVGRAAPVVLGRPACGTLSKAAPPPGIEGESADGRCTTRCHVAGRRSFAVSLGDPQVSDARQG